MSKHTPGPWQVEHGGVNSFDVWLEGWKVPKLTENEANGRLIAAAPDMLAALKGLRCIMSETRCECDDCLASKASAYAAIAKAEGKHE